MAGQVDLRRFYEHGDSEAVEVIEAILEARIETATEEVIYLGYVVSTQSRMNLRVRGRMSDNN